MSSTDTMNNCRWKCCICQANIDPNTITSITVFKKCGRISDNKCFHIWRTGKSGLCPGCKESGEQCKHEEINFNFDNETSPIDDDLINDMINDLKDLYNDLENRLADDDENEIKRKRFDTMFQMYTLLSDFFKGRV